MVLGCKSVIDSIYFLFFQRKFLKNARKDMVDATAAAVIVNGATTKDDVAWLIHLFKELSTQ
jgi:hypothetical protein